MIVLKAVQEGKTEEEKKRFELAAKYLVHADEGVNAKNLEYARLKEDVALGKTYVEEQKQLEQAAKVRDAKIQL